MGVEREGCPAHQLAVVRLPTTWQLGNLATCPAHQLAVVLTS